MPKLSESYYLRSIDRRWKRELKDSQQRVLVFSPYITSKTAEGVLQCATPEKCEIHTTFAAEIFATGASSIQTLARLSSSGFKLFSIPDLHAKVILVDDKFVSIGSQNLTSRGCQNVEATVAISDPSDINAISGELALWIDRRSPISAEMISKMEASLPELVKKFRAITKAAADIDTAIFEMEQLRREEQQKLEARRQEQRRIFESIAFDLRHAISRLTPQEGVSLETAQAFIRESAWWDTHSSGKSIPAPGDANRIYREDGELKLFGPRTKFLVGLAIKRCCDAVLRTLTEIENGKSVTEEELTGVLYRCVSGSVANKNGEYRGYYPIVYNQLKFGAHSIYLKGFIRQLYQALPIGRLYYQIRKAAEENAQVSSNNTGNSG